MILKIAWVSLALASLAVAAPVHLWEKQELTFTAAHAYANPYTEVTVWVDLTGPNFKKRVYGFWDGERTFRVRLLATEPGAWSWQSGSSPADEGLAGRKGAFSAVAWSEEEKRQNTVRRGFLRPTANHHAIEQADGTPFFILGDTWWAAGTNCFRWYDDNQQRSIGPTAGFKDYVRYRKAQGFNLVGIIASWPNWVNDSQPAHIEMNDADHTLIRAAWLEFGTEGAKNISNEGGLPFFFPGKVPGYENEFADVDRINPKYFDYLDRKIDYLNAQGFIPFVEVSRRDSSPAWKKYYQWPDSYARYIEYIFARLQANNTVLSPIHFDTPSGSVPAADYKPAIQMALTKYGPPPFGNLLTANANPSTLANWGQDSWVTLHQIGNRREHDFYWYLTEIYHALVPQPAINGEPYYAGYRDARGKSSGKKKAGYQFGAEGGTLKDDQFVRSAMYGSFLSGAFAGQIYGAEGIWGADVQPAASPHMWEAFQWNSASQMQHLRTFAFSVGKHLPDLIPDADLVSPNKTHEITGYEGWAYCAHTPEKDFVLAYFEKGCPTSQIRSLKPLGSYRAQWFDPRTGTWSDVRNGWLQSNVVGVVILPEFQTDLDWGLRLIYAGPTDPRQTNHKANPK